MKNFFLPFILCITALAQTASYPGAVATDATLFKAANNVGTRLLAAQAIGDTVAIVLDSTGIVAPMLVSIGTTKPEIEAVCAVSGNTLTIGVSGTCPSIAGRGFDSTAAVAHNPQTPVNVNDVAYLRNIDSAHIEAIETALGPNLQNVLATIPNGPFTNVSAYAWTPVVSGSGVSVSGGNLIVGNNTLTFAVVPKGVNGTDIGHELYVSGGSGTAGPCLISGGGGIAGAVNGQIILNCPATHTGAWSVGTATGYIQEAIAATASGGVVYAAPGTYALNAAVQLPGKLTLEGAGQGAAILRIANNAWTRATNQWAHQGAPGGAGYFCAVCLAAGADRASVRDLTLDENGANQTFAYMPGDLSGYNATNSSFINVSVINRMLGGTGVGMGFYGHTPRSANSNNLISNGTVIGLPNCVVPTGGGAYYIEGESNRIINSYSYNTCDTAYVVADCTHCSTIGNTGDVGTGQAATPMWTVAGLYNMVADNHCTSTGTNNAGPCFEVDNGTNEVTDGNIFLNNVADHCQYGAEISNVTFANHLVTDTTFSALTVKNCNIGINISGNVDKVTIDGAHLSGNNYAGISMVGASTRGPNHHVTITNSHLDHNALGIILQQSGLPLDLVTGLTITGNFIGDTALVPVQTRAIYLDGGLANEVIIKDNTMTGATIAPFFLGNTFDKNLVMGPNIVSTTGDPDYGTYPIWNWNSGNARGRMQSFNDTHDYSVLSENYRHTTASTGTVDNAALGTAEVSVIGLNGAGGAVQLKAGGVNTAPSVVLNCQIVGCTIVNYTAATLPVAATGTMVYCSDCTTAAVCTGGGSGHLAVHNFAAWTCQ